jgi:hypothetical protein
MQALSKSLTARIYDTIIGQLSEPVSVSRTMANDSFVIELLEYGRKPESAGDG